MSEKLLPREWIAIGAVLGSIFTILTVSKISEKRIYKILEKASFVESQGKIPPRKTLRPTR